MSSSVHDGTALDGAVVKLPGPADDATPSVLRCYVKRAPFRPVIELEPGRRPLYEEYKLYVWRSATLRDIATLLYARDASLSSPLTPHSFRIVTFDGQLGHCVAREAGDGVTRASSDTLDRALRRVLANDCGHDDPDHVTVRDRPSSNTTFRSIADECKPRHPPSASDAAASTTLNDLDWQDGDILDCIIHSASAPAASSSSLQGRRILGSGAQSRWQATHDPRRWASSGGAGPQGNSSSGGDDHEGAQRPSRRRPDSLTSRVYPPARSDRRSDRHESRREAERIHSAHRRSHADRNESNEVPRQSSSSPFSGRHNRVPGK